MVGDRRLLEEVAVLAAVRSGGVLAEQRDPIPRLFEVHAVLDTLMLDEDIASNRTLKTGAFQTGHGLSYEIVVCWRMMSNIRLSAWM